MLITLEVRNVGPMRVDSLHGGVVTLEAPFLEPLVDGGNLHPLLAQSDHDISIFLYGRHTLRR
ncbi:MAG TPA: hypothetical protein VK905_04990 [Bacillota bacterium]|nr:hypothetical protein [Bacillota bacterium]